MAGPYTLGKRRAEMNQLILVIILKYQRRKIVRNVSAVFIT
jgi:hypothetical protein